MNYVVVDLEWNQAMSSKSSVFNRLPIHLRGEIIQIGAVRLNEDMTPGEEFQIDVKPVYFKRMHYKVKKLTGFDKERLSHGVSFPEALAQFREWCGDGVTFLTWGYDDQGIMEQNIIIHDLDWDWISGWVNLQLIYNLQTDGDKNQKSLATAMEHFAIEQTRVAHDALGDAYNTALVCSKLNFAEGLEQYDNATSLLATRLPEDKHHTDEPDALEHRAFTGYNSRSEAFLDEEVTSAVCPDCGGSRLRKEALYVKIGGKTIADLVVMPVETLADFFASLELDAHDTKTAARILTEIRNRLQYLMDVGLGYLTLDRLSSTLSGGESQRINLSTSLGSNLVGSLYILDEPSIGLHPRDTNRLVGVLEQLRDIGNTVIVVEHEEEVIRAADWIVDIGPEAGYNGGEVVFSGPLKALLKEKKSLTADYLTGRCKIAVPTSRRSPAAWITVKGARQNNLKNIDVRIPLGVMTCITGVSGSGKSSLAKGILYPALRRLLFDTGLKPGDFDAIEGDLSTLRSVEMVDQNPIGKSSRSNPVTYIKAYDEIRKLYADQPYAQRSGFNPSHFSFNIAGGRCEECQGEGFIKVGMQFMADVELVCEACGGKRFKDEILEVRYREKSIYDILEMTVDDAIAFFGDDKKNATCKRIIERLRPLQEVGLGYIRLGQSSSTLSGGESQRVKLASFLSKESTEGNVMFIFDEPTTGLHFHDINKLLDAFNALIARGHTIVIVEHNMDVIKCADWVVDLGPEAGDRGGSIVFEGTPDGLAGCKESYTGRYLALREKNE